MRYLTDKELLKKRLLELKPKMLRLFGCEPAVLQLKGSTMVVGDIHGNLNSLKLMIDEWEESGYDNILFLGDYVDRGTQGTECLAVLFDLKLTYPDRVFLLRGNHEDEHMNRYYGFFSEVGFDDNFLMQMHKVFETLPVAAVLDGKVFCVHGGINKETDLRQITKNQNCAGAPRSKLAGYVRASTQNSVKEGDNHNMV